MPHCKKRVDARSVLAVRLALFCFLTGLFVSQSHHAQAADNVARDQSRDQADEEYNFSWLDPDKKVYVIQNRKYRKAQHFALYISGGLNLTNPYRTEYLGVPRAAYWFTEQFGVEAFFATVTNSDNGNLTALKKASPTALPFVREHRNFVGGVFAWAPWYAKINFFNKILYFDWYLNAGLGQVSTAFDQNTRADRTSDFKLENFVSFFFGTGQNFYLNRNFSVRLDLIGMMYSATAADNSSKRTTTNFDFTVGVGYLF